MTRVIVVRHGETQQNREHIIQGQQNTPLNARGEEQAAEIGAMLREKEPGINAVFSSSLARAYRTAEIIAGETLPVVELPGFRERYMGQLEGMTRQQAVSQRNHDGRRSLLEYGESEQHLVQRLLTAWEELKTLCEERNYNTVVLVSHGGAMYQLFKALRSHGYQAGNPKASSQLRADPKIVNCSVTIIDGSKCSFETYAEQWTDSIVRERDEL